MDEKYSAALERAKVVIFNAYHEETKTACKEIFPELAENEDEKIRKYLIGYVKNAGCGSDLFDSINTKEAILGYLEKQKYYWKPTEEDVTLFNKAITTNTSLTPQDRAKLDIIRMKFKHHPNIEQKEQKPVERSVEDNHIIGFVYDLLNEIKWKDDWAMSKEECLRLLSNYSPQKPAELNEEDERIRKDCVHFLELQKSHHADTNEIDKCIAWLEKRKEQKPVEIVRIPKFRVGDIVQHVHEKWDRTMKIAEIDEYGYRYDFSHRGHPVWGGGFGFTCEDDYELVERKPVMWSEEDEKQYQFVLDELRYAYSELTCHNSTIDSIKQFEKAVAWLDDRVKFICPQAKQEWSKEDKGNLLAVRCIIDGVWHDQDAREKMERSEEELESLWKWLDNIWTKVVYPESQWKPSEEQMDALNYVRQFDYGGHKATLESLYDDLKKL